jgi:hypothetical protein
VDEGARGNFPGFDNHAATSSTVSMPQETSAEAPTPTATPTILADYWVTVAAGSGGTIC